MEVNIDKVRSILDRYSREEFGNKAYELAFNYGTRQGSCPQCTIRALQDILELPDGGVLKSAFLLAGGIGASTKSACGALAGGVVALGSLFGRSRGEFDENVHTSRGTDLARRLLSRFQDEYGGITCADVQLKVFGRVFDLPNSDGFAEFEKINKELKKCPEVEGRGCRWAAEIIWDALHDEEA